MANFNLFASSRGAQVPTAASRNEAGGQAYARQPKAALALYAATGCLSNTYYASAEQQLDHVLALCAQVEPAFVAKTAIYTRQRGHMKDMPALLLASLSARDGEVFERAFGRVIDNGRMLRNFVQIVRSGRIGRKSLGSRPKRLVRQWIDNASVEQLLAAAIGNQPSLADVIKMVHPKPADAERAALYAWLIDKPFDESALPAKVRAYEAFKRSQDAAMPKLPFQYFTSLPLSVAHWTQLARTVSWQTLRMNLNTFQRHGVFANRAVAAEVAGRLRDPDEIRNARVFPYQLMSAYHAGGELPAPIVAALQDAMEIATRQVPALEGEVVVAVDVSGSMASPVTGYRQGSTSKVRCVDVA
ncbi:MAG: TROVE domain-containing protein, partial [Lysobacter sp.]